MVDPIRLSHMVTNRAVAAASAEAELLASALDEALELCSEYETYAQTMGDNPPAWVETMRRVIARGIRL